MPPWTCKTWELNNFITANHVRKRNRLKCKTICHVTTKLNFSSKRNQFEKSGKRKGESKNIANDWDQRIYICLYHQNQIDELCHTIIIKNKKEY